MSTANTSNKSKKVKVFIASDPLSKGIEHDQVYVSVNGKPIMIKTDEAVEVDEAYAEVIERSERFRKAANKYAKSQDATT